MPWTAGIRVLGTLTSRLRHLAKVVCSLGS
jgi:hypothetical protein